MDKPDKKELVLESSEIPSRIIDYRGIKVPYILGEKEFWKKASLFQFIYSLIGLIIGSACVIAGILFFLHGVGNSTSWTTNIIRVETNISDAVTGVILFIAGLFIVWITKFSINTKFPARPSGSQHPHNS